MGWQLVQKLQALEGLARLAVGDTTDPAGALSEATRTIGAVIGSDDVRLFAGDGFHFESYPPREGEDFFGLSPAGLLSASEELRRLGCAAVFAVGREGLPHDIAPADGRGTGTHLGFALWKRGTYSGTVVARGAWSAAVARRAGRFLESAGPALVIMFDRVAGADRTERVQQQMNVLADVTPVFTRAENMRGVLTEVVSAIDSATGFVSNIDVLDTRGRIVMRKAAANRYAGTPLYESWMNMTRAPDLVRRMILKHRQPVLLPDLQNDPRVSEEARQFYRQASLVSGATFPLLFQDELVGLLRVGSLRPTSFTPPVVDLLRNLALQAAAVVKGVRLWEELKRSRKEAERYAATLQARNENLLNEISERERAEEALRGSERKYRDLVENINEVIYTLDRSGRITYASPAVELVGGYDPSEVIGRSLTEFIHPDDLPHLVDYFQRTVSGNLEPSEYRILTKSGEIRWVRTSSRPVLDGDRVVGLRAVMIDITDRRQAENQIRYLAYHDGLTGLPNRALLKDRLSMALAQRRRDKRQLAVMFLDLDYLKLVNDTVGHAMADQVLHDVAERLASIVREGDTVARIGGDEFTVLLPAISGLEDACEVAERILERFRRPWVLAGHEFHITASIGIAMCPQDGEDAETLLTNADTAMYCAKDQGRDNYQIFASGMNAHIQERGRLESDLHRALRRLEPAAH